MGGNGLPIAKKVKSGLTPMTHEVKKIGIKSKKTKVRGGCSWGSAAAAEH